ncbi:hypothetical protein LOY28_21005 [Pseudomonas sp. B21-017]|uniref:hypothetical protein n=1 Tax=Pseudomonas sp. B21-017 TaxID=2895474 RepID=UPI00215F5FFF|nr:hypothetical protein [Pseudomonas sp. B21-017]UVM37177.1 hypothetical protein LOY28_21005 [Pseudomonas sp. B21-017]
MKLPDTKPSLESAFEDNTYSGTATFLYSSKITGNVNLEGMCEILAGSDAFSFALTSRGKIYFTEDNRLRSQQLSIEPTITEQGMTVSGHNDFLKANPGDSNTYALSLAFNLLLSDKRLFNSAHGFPTESARIFMRPIAIRCEDDEDHELVLPYIRVYTGGIISISLATIAGFEESTIQRVVRSEVNKSRQNLASVLCERELHMACTECQMSQMSRWERLAQREAFETIMGAALNNPGEIEFVDERLTIYELVHTDQLTLTDIARNFLSVVARTIAAGAVQTRIRWYGSQYEDDSIGQHWRGKPILYIRSHTNQKRSSFENWSAHRSLVNSVMVRTFLSSKIAHADLNLKDMRNFDDYNNFYSESVSLMLASSQVEAIVEQHDSYTFNNLTSDIQVLNEASHFIQTYYSYASLGLDKCKTAIDVARLELDILAFEETLLSAHKYGEIAKYIEGVQKGDQLITICKLLHKKIETVRKSLELDDKIKSESYTRRITIIFGIIASATLSPEMMQPMAKYFDVLPENGDLAKLYGIGASVIVVAGLLVLSHYAFKIKDRIIKTLHWR